MVMKTATEVMNDWLLGFIDDGDDSALLNLYAASSILYVVSESVVGPEEAVDFWRSWQEDSGQVVNTVVAEHGKAHALCDLIGSRAMAVHHIDVEAGKIVRSWAAAPGGCPVCNRAAT